MMPYDAMAALQNCRPPGSVTRQKATMIDCDEDEVDGRSIEAVYAVRSVRAHCREIGWQRLPTERTRTYESR